MGQDMLFRTGSVSLISSRCQHAKNYVQFRSGTWYTPSKENLICGQFLIHQYLWPYFRVRLCVVSTIPDRLTTSWMAEYFSRNLVPLIIAGNSLKVYYTTDGTYLNTKTGSASVIFIGLGVLFKCPASWTNKVSWPIQFGLSVKYCIWEQPRCGLLVTVDLQLSARRPDCCHARRR